MRGDLACEKANFTLFASKANFCLKAVLMMEFFRNFKTLKALKFKRFLQLKARVKLG